MSHNFIEGILQGSTIAAIKGDTRRLDYGSYCFVSSLNTVPKVRSMALSPPPKNTPRPLIRCRVQGLGVRLGLQVDDSGVMV